MYGFRTDVGTLQPAKRLADGRLVADAHITRPGVFEYSDPDAPNGIRRELRPESEVFDSASMDSFANLPVTPGHPTKDGRRILLTAENAKQHMVGSTGDRVQRDDDLVRAKVMIADASTIKRMDSGSVEVSCGYTCDYDEVPGVDPKYGRYDGVQRKIRGNHLAVAVGTARAGRTARVRMDSELDAEERNQITDKSFAFPEERKLPLENKGHALDALGRFEDTDFSAHPGAQKTAYHKIVAAAKKFGIDTTNFEKKHGGRFDAARNPQGDVMADEKLENAIRVLEADLTAKTAEASTQKLRADAAETAHGELKGRVESLEGENTTLRTQIAAGAMALETEAVMREKARADAAEAKVARFDEVSGAAIRARTSLMLSSALVMGHEFRMDDLSDGDIRRAVVKRLDASANIAKEVPDAEIKGKFDHLVEGFKRNARSQGAIAIALAGGTQARNDSQQVADDKAARMQKFRDQWKEPLPNDIRRKKEG